MTITTVRPNATALQVNVATTGSVAPHTVLSDTNNATRAVGTQHQGRVEVDVGTVAVSASVRLRQARIGLVFAHDGVDIGHIERVNYRFVDGLSGVSGIDTQASSYSSTFPAANAPVYGPWNTTAPNGSAWTQPVIDALRVRLFWLASVNFQFLLVSEVYVQYETNAQPVVSGVTVSGATTTTRPTGSYTYTGDDLQVAKRVRVFTAAQFGAVGFDPETSPGAWDSGEVLDGITTFTVGTDLVNGTTYRAYVKAAQSWPGPEGPRWYSAWTASSNFTIALSPPPSPSITVTQQFGTPHYRNLITVSLAGVNLLSADNAGFEGGIGTWVNSTNATLAASTTNPKSGTQDLQLTAIGAGAMTVGSSSFAGASRVTPLAQYSATASLRAGTTGRTVSVGIRWFDITGAVISSTFGTGVADNNAGYTTVTVTTNAPANAYSAVILVNVAAAGGAGEIHRVDEVALMAGAGTTWTPGGYATGYATIVAQERISIATTRNPAGNLLHPQLYSGGGLLFNADSFTPRQANDSAVFRLLDRSPPEASGNTTQGSIEWVIRTAAVSFFDVGYANGVVTTETQARMFAAAPGQTYTFTMWLWASSSVTARLGIVFIDELNTVIGSTTFSTTANLTGTEQKVVVTATAPAGACAARGVVENTSGGSGYSIFMTNPRFRHSTFPDQPWPGQVFESNSFVIRDGIVGLPTDGSTTVTRYHHEAPPDRYVTYYAILTGTTPGGQLVASPPSRHVSVYMTPPTFSVLKAAFGGFGAENAFEIRTRARGDTVTRTADEQELHPAGRDGDPVFGRDWISGDTGTLTIFLQSELEIYRLEQLVPSSLPVLIQWRLGGQIYAHVGSITLQRQRELNAALCAETYAVATVTYSEQARPD